MNYIDIATTLVKTLEGFSSVPYLDSAGIPTIGYGCTFYKDGTKVKMSDTCITQDDASQLLSQILTQFSDGLMKIIPSTLTSNQIAALLSFSYNVGLKAFANSTLLKVVTKDPYDYKNIKIQFLRWIYAGDKRLQGLINRRMAEYSAYATLD